VEGRVEWGSELHGDGQGDPHQPGGLGSGGANFDASWQGNALGIGGGNDNVHSEIAGSSGGVLAYCESPIADGWRIRFYSGWTWDDGPGTPALGDMDLQGVATHEYGHALGLGHSDVVGATMYASVNASGVAQRSLAPDDVAGVQAVYGAKSPTKPRITQALVDALAGHAQADRRELRRERERGLVHPRRRQRAERGPGRQGHGRRVHLRRHVDHGRAPLRRRPGRRARARPGHEPRLALERLAGRSREPRLALPTAVHHGL
jgi:hypothetical protein